MTQYRSLLLLCLPACSVYIDADRVQCKTDADCADRGSAFTGSVCRNSLCQPLVDETWACLDDPITREPPSTTVHVNMTVVDLLSQKPVSGLTIALCAKLDANCSYQLGQFQSNEAGQIDVAMPAGFDGYFQAEGAGIYPTLIFPPSTAKQRPPSTLPIVSASFFPTMFRGIGVSSIGEDRSVILTTALDCLGRPIAGMLLQSEETDESTVPYVIQGGLPNKTANVTDESGSGGFVNIKAGSAVITSTIAASNRLAGTVAVQTRTGYLTMVLVTPTGG